MEVWGSLGMGWIRSNFSGFIIADSKPAASTISCIAHVGKYFPYSTASDKVLQPGLSRCHTKGGASTNLLAFLE